MKNLPLWTKTLAIVSLTAFGAAACDGGGEQTTADADIGFEQDDTYADGEVQEQDTDVIGYDDDGIAGGIDQQEEDIELQEDDVDLYGQDDALQDQTDDDRFAQGN